MKQAIFDLAPALSQKTLERAKTVTHVLMGSLFIAACAQITLPLYPVPMTMQTLGIFLLAIMQGGRKSSYSLLCYLALAFIGLPVLAGGKSAALWLALPTAGYLIAFPIAAYIVGKLVSLKEKPSALWLLLSILVGKVIIYTFGVAGLMRFLSFEQSLMVGVVPFLLVAAIKVLLATSLGGLWLRWKKQ